MPQTLFELNFNSINTSVQAGDAVFHINNFSSIGDIDYSSETHWFFGIVHSVNENKLLVLHNTGGRYPSAGDYIMFAKDTAVNTSGVKGYYLSANFVNDSKDKAELFSVGSEISESSK